MKKKDVEIGATYTAKISGKIVEVRIFEVCTLGGWHAVNLKTGRDVRIKSATKLREKK